MTARHRLAVCLLVFHAMCCSAIIAQPKLPAPASRPTTTSRPTTPSIIIGSKITPPQDAMPREVLDVIYRHELGQKYATTNIDLLYNAHCLVEKYFAAEYAEDRRALIKWINQLGVDANILGRITRIRMDWPALDGGVYYVNERVGPHDVTYFMGVPQGYDRTTSWPMVIMLPASVPFVTNPPPDADAVTKLYTDWINEELAKHPDAIVLMPLLNLKECWGPSYAGMFSVMGSMQHAAGRVNVDPARVYLVGHSMSGHATWNLALHYSTYFAAINPMAGAASADWQRLRVMNLRNVLPVVWHDADDLLIPVKHARELVAILHKLKLDVSYEESTNVGHAPTPEIVQRCYEKMRARTRELYPRDVPIQSNRPDTHFNRNDWVQMYQAMTPGKDQRVLFRIGSGHLILSTNSMSLQAIITVQNKIEVKSTNVQAMRYYVNDQMIDFGKPVTVLVNGKPRFEKVLQPSVEEMLTDQLFLGRGWRYYTAVIDIEFGEPISKPTTKPAINLLPK